MKEITGNNWKVTFSNRLTVGSTTPVPSITASNMIKYNDGQDLKCSTMEELLISKTDNTNEWVIMYFEAVRQNIIGCRVCKIEEIENTLKNMNILNLDDVISDIAAKVNSMISEEKVSNNQDMAEIMSDIMVRLDIDRSEFRKNESQKEYNSSVIFYPKIGDPKSAEHISRVRDALIGLAKYMKSTEFSKFGYEHLSIKEISISRDETSGSVNGNHINVKITYKLK